MSPTRKTASKPSVKPSKTMRELLAATGCQIRGSNKGDQVEAIVTQKRGTKLTFDIGGKTEAVVGEKETEWISPLVKTLKEGDKVSGRVILSENRLGQAVITLKPAATAFRWQRVKKALETKQTIEVRGLEINSGGLLVRVESLGNFRGFIPSSLLDPNSNFAPRDLVNRVLKVKVIEAEASQNRLVFSQKAVVDEELKESRQAIIPFVKINAKYKAEIHNVSALGLFVRLSLKPSVVAEAQVPLVELSWGQINDIRREFKSGQIIEVKALQIDKDSNLVICSLKALVKNPWQVLAKKFKPDQALKGSIVKITGRAVFVEIEKGVQGAIEKKRLPLDFDKKPGDSIRVVIEAIDPQSQKLTLSPVLKKKPIGYK